MLLKGNLYPDAVSLHARDRRDIQASAPARAGYFSLHSVIVALTVFLTAFAPLNPALADRLALVIANSDYTNTSKLDNPANDAELIAGKLKELGFDVRLEKNLSARGLADVLHDFSSHLDKDTDALFYYAGHGLQFRGENFLVGVDAQLRSEASLQFETFSLNTVINQLEKRASTTLLFWDACRNNPLAEELVRSVAPEGQSPSVRTRGGAAPVPPRRGDTLIVFSAEPGKLALDGSGKFSPFAEALGYHITSPNVEVESMLKRVTRDVMNSSKQYQRPERLSQLTREFYFRRESRDEANYEQELKELRAKLALLERDANTSRKRFQIVKVDATEAREPKRLATRSPQLAKDQGAKTKGEVSAPQEPSPPAGTASIPDTTNAEVVVAVKQSAATIVRRLRVSPDSKLLAVGDDQGMVRIVQLEPFEVIRTIQAHTARISDLDFSPDSRTLLSAGRDGFIRYWDAASGQKTRELSQPGVIPYSARINSAFPDRWVLAGDKGGRIIAWDLRRNRVITNSKFHQGPVLSVAYQSGSGGVYFSAGGDGEMKFRLPDGKRFAVHAHTGAVFHADYSSSGKLLYTVGGDRKVKIWETAAMTSKQPRVLNGHLRYVLAADMSLDEKQLVSGGGDKALNLWSVETGKLIGRLEGHTNDVEAVTFTPNGKLVVSSSEDNSVRIWSVENKEELVRLFFHKDSAKYVGVTFDNQIFGDRDSGLISTFVDGREVSGADADRVSQYIGHRIAIVEQ